MTAHNLLSPERSRQEESRQRRFHNLFHLSRPVTVLSVALLAATAVLGSAINTTSYLDSITAALPVSMSHHLIARRSVHTQDFTLLGSSASSDSVGQVLGATDRQVPYQAPVTAAATSTIAGLVNNQLNQYLSQGLLTGPAGPQGPAGATVTEGNNNGQTTIAIGGNPIVTYVPSNPANGFAGGSLAGFTELSAGSFASGNSTINGTLNVSGPVSVSTLNSSGNTAIGANLNVSGVSALSTTSISSLTIAQFLAVTSGGTGTNTLASLTSGNNFLTVSGGQNVLIGTSTQISLSENVIANVSTGTSGSIFNISTSTNSVTINLPFASAVNTGQLQAADWTTFNNKLSGSGTNGYVVRYTGASSTATGILLDDGTVAGVNATSSLASFNIQGSGTLNPLTVTSSTGASLFGVSANGNVSIGTSTTAGYFDNNLLNGLFIAPTAPNNLNQNRPAVVLQGNYANGTHSIGDYRIYANDASTSQVSTWSMSFRSLGTFGSGPQGLTFYFDRNNSSFPALALTNTQSALFFGAVGVNTSTPAAMFSVQGQSGSTTPEFMVASSSNAVNLVVTSAGSVGIGTSVPVSTLAVTGNLNTVFGPGVSNFQVNSGIVDNTGSILAAGANVGAGVLNQATVSTSSSTQNTAGGISQFSNNASSGNFNQGYGAYNEASNQGGGTIGTLLGSYNLAYNTANSSVSGSAFGSLSKVYNASGTIANAFAVSGTVNNVGAQATMTNATGLFAGIRQSSTGSIANAYGLQVSSPSNSGGTITNDYGVYVADQTLSGTNSWNIYSLGGRNYLQGFLSVGTTSTSSTLTLQGSGPTDPFNVSSSTGASLFHITSVGNVGIGTTSPQYLLQVGSASVASGTVARFQNANGTCDINPTTNTLACSSDERLKKNITPLGDDLSQVMALQPVYFNWNAETSGTPEHPGFIAQQVQQIMPEVVSTDPSTGLLSIGYSDLVPAVVGAIHQMQAEITTLQGGLGGNASSSILTVYSPADFSGDSVGEAEIPAGQTSVHVSFSQAYAHQPIVTFSPESLFVPAFISAKDASGFTLTIVAATTTPVTFDWHSFASPSEQLTVSGNAPQPITLVVATSASVSTQPLEMGPDPASSATTLPAAGASLPTSTPSDLSASTPESAQDPAASTTTPSTASSSTPAVRPLATQDSGMDGAAQDHASSPATTAVPDSAAASASTATTSAPTAQN